MDVQKLLQNASEYLIQRKNDDVGNQPLYPTIIIFCGKTTAEHYRGLKRNIDLNWGRYANQIPYMELYSGETGQLCAKDLRTDKEEEPQILCESMINQMLALPRVFYPDRMRLKVECIISSEDNWELYRNFLEKVGEDMAMTPFKTVYMMIEQDTSEKRRHFKSFMGHFIESLEEKEKQYFSSVYLLSNYLENNFLLLDKELEKNYRLVANLILLGGNIRNEQNENSDRNRQLTSKIYNGTLYKTASYAIKQKPTEEIVVNCIEYFLSEVVKQQENSYREWSIVKKQLGIENRQIDIYEKFYSEIQKELPGKEVMYYFPKREGKVSEEIKGFEQQTYGSVRLFFEKYFLDEVLNKWVEKNLEHTVSEILKFWERTLSFSEIKKYFVEPEMREDMKRVTILVSSDGSDLESRMHARYQETVKKLFYEKITETLFLKLDEEQKKCRNFEAIYKEIQKTVAECNYSSREQKKSIEGCYYQEISQFLQKEKESIEKKLINLDNKKEDLLEQIEIWFKKMADSIEIFNLSFEDELVMRTAEKSEEDKFQFLKNELNSLNDELDQAQRIHFFRIPNMKTVYHLMNTDAEYAKMLKSEKTEEYIFDLNRTDCIEKIAIFDIDRLGDINYMEESRNADVERS